MIPHASNVAASISEWAFLNSIATCRSEPTAANLVATLVRHSSQSDGGSVNEWPSPRSRERQRVDHPFDLEKPSAAGSAQV